MNEDETLRLLPVEARELSATFCAYVIAQFNGDERCRILRALAFAANAHDGQTRDDATPYILHPLRAALSLMRECGLHDADLVCAALLHDVLEDAPTEPSGLRDAFGARVAEMVGTLTRPHAHGRSREQVNVVYFDRLRCADDNSKLIKLLDKLDNLRDAHNSPDPEKRRRTRVEAEQFYLSLCRTLSNLPLREKVSALLQHEVESLRWLDP